MSPLPSEFDNEISALTREFSKQEPSDVLQFCSNHFLRRLESQRAEHLLNNVHSSQKGAPAMAASSFPGVNPFGGPPTASTSTSKSGMQTFNEEEEDDHFASTGPTTRNVDASVGPTASAPQSQPSLFTTPSFGGGFGGGGFGGSFGGNNSSASSRLPPMEGSSLPDNYHFNRRTSVSAESMVPSAASDENWQPPHHFKTPEQQARIRQAIASNFLFSHLDDNQASQVIGALSEKQIPTQGIKVITQGDVGDYFYVVEKGSFDIHIHSSGKFGEGPDALGNKVASISTGGSFGELALMYNAPRAATVISTEPSTLWLLDRVTFRRILMESAFQKRTMYEDFLAEVQVLESLTPYERSKIADALHTQKYPAGHTIIQEGEPGDNFYIIESGHAEVYKRGTQHPVAKLTKGDYFGELALLNDKPRAASVVSSSEVKLAMLDKEGFQRLLGPVEAIMRRNDYNAGNDNAA